MNFFEQQDRTQRNTKLLVFLFVVAVVTIILAVYVAIMFLWFLGATKMGMLESFRWWDTKLFASITGGTVLIVGFGCLHMIQQLSAGGSAVAQRLGGRLIPSNTIENRQKQLLNVVEEMAIASGTPVPEVYLLGNEKGINAFAAGYTPSDAVIGVTQGCLDLLSRSQLQGVIAHEFSHIIQGDMRLNIRLTGMIHGILSIAMIGMWLIRSSTYRSGFSHRRRGGLEIVLGGTFVVIGYIGVLFGRLIKATVSRQREFFADAAAVQFTRNPSGLSGALKTIGGFHDGSRVKTHHSEEMSHMFFGNALRSSFFQSFSTHPPLTDRIRLLDPSFDGMFTIIAAPAKSTQTTSSQISSLAQPSSTQVTSQLMKQVGQPTPEHLSRAATAIPALPPMIYQAAHDPAGAPALVFALLMDESSAIQTQQLNFLLEHYNHALIEETKQLTEAFRALGTSARLPLIDLAMPALKQMSASQYAVFSQVVIELIRIDRKVTMFEFALTKILLRHLSSKFRKVDKGKIKYRSLRPILNDAGLLLSALADVGHKDLALKDAAYSNGLRRLTSKPLPRTLHDEWDIPTLHRAFVRLAQTSPSLKRELLEASAATVETDGKVTREEAELIRAIADTLDCPIPPLLG